MTDCLNIDFLSHQSQYNSSLKDYDLTNNFDNIDKNYVERNYVDVTEEEVNLAYRDNSVKKRDIKAFKLNENEKTNHIGAFSKHSITKLNLQIDQNICLIQIGQSTFVILALKFKLCTFY